MDSWLCEDPQARSVELEAAVGRGKLKYGDIEFLGLGVRSRKTNFRSPLLETESAYTPIPRSSAVRQVKVARLSRGPPLTARTPMVSSYISNGRDRENNDRDRS